VDAVERLVAIEEIKQLKARYFRCMDTKDWDGFAAVFTDDAVMDMRGEMRDGTTEGDGLVTGASSIAAFVRGAVDAVTTVHHGHMPEIDVTGPDTATGVWAMEDKLRWPEGSPIAALHGYGHYHEDYARRDGGWRIARTTLTRLRIDVW
jgi:uncharacterized protein (TIGR02246 family)